jgi:hypothetical protein
MKSVTHLLDEYTRLTDRSVGNSICIQVRSLLSESEFHAEWLRDEP